MPNLYFKNVSNNGYWNNVLNWFTDYACTTQAANVPWVFGDATYLEYDLTRGTDSIAAEDDVFIDSDIVAEAAGTCDIGFIGIGGSFGAITNNSAIYGGTFSGEYFNNYNYINGGTFSGDGLTNINGTIYGGTFSGGYFTNSYSTIYGGTFSGGYFTNSSYGKIYGGTFSGGYFTNSSYGKIYGGTFSGGYFSNSLNGTIYGGNWLESGNLVVTSYDYTEGETTTTVAGRYGNPEEYSYGLGFTSIRGSSDILGTGLL